MDDESWRSHRFIRYADEKLPRSEASSIVAYLLNQWTGTRLSPSQHRRTDPKLVTSADGSTVRVSFDDLVDHVRATRSFKASEFGLPSPESDWLDYSVEIAKPDAPIATEDYSAFAKFALALPFGERFPLHPTIDREGAAYATFQLPIQQNICALHRRLVDASHHATRLGQGDWRNDLRMLVNESISLIDITLHQLYFMAQYRGREKGWNFDSNDLGPRHGQRLKEKLGWINKITRRPLDNAGVELEAFHRLRVVRNHFNHFDPPCVAYTVEDIVAWLNDIPAIGRLAWKIREKADTQLSAHLIEIIALPRAEFVPRRADVPRVPQPNDVGYASVVWPEKQANS